MTLFYNYFISVKWKAKKQRQENDDRTFSQKLECEIVNLNEFVEFVG